MSNSLWNRFLLAWCVAVTVMATSPSVWARPRYRAVLIQDNGADFNYGNASPGAYPQINDHNQIVFLNAYIDNKFTARYWENGRLYRLGNDTGYTWLSAHAINNQSEFAGDLIYNTDTGGVLIQHPHPFRTFNKVVTELPLDPGAHQFDSACYNSRATDLNDLGVAAGWVRRPITRGYQLDYAVVWNSGGITDIGPLNPHPPDSQFAQAPYVVINNSGTVAGMYFVNYSGCQSCYLGWYGTPGAITQVSPFPGGKAVALWDINNLGVLAGNSDLMIGPTYVANHAMLVSGGVKQDIHGTVYPATTQSRAYALNDSGAAVGSFQNFRGFYHDNDTTWLLDSLLVNNATFPDLYEGFDINNSGLIVALCGWPSGTPRPCLLVPVDSIWYVNTTNDLPDQNPNDGRCFTGNITPLGEDECSFRAAIQHANATASLDTIRFRIREGQAGAPVIRPHSSGLGTLPHVLQPTLIDGTTQPFSGRVAIDGSLLPPAGNGLQVDAAGSTVRGLAIYGSTWNGLQINGDSVRVENCLLGVDADSNLNGNLLNGILVFSANACQIGGATPEVANRVEGNRTHGIRIIGDSCKVQGNVIRQNGFSTDTLMPSTGSGIAIDGTGNLVGGETEAEGNEIIGNNDPGVHVIWGTGNRIRSNSIDSNQFLGIDLDPFGRTSNDTLDADGGANLCQNHPLIDSVFYGPGHPTLHGHLVSAPNRLYQIQIFKSPDCDPSKYGEGRDLIYSAVTFSNADGVAAFGPWVLLEADDDAFLTATATDPDGNTSEFSPCFSAPRLVILDVDSVPIAHQRFELYRVTSGSPTFNEVPLDTATTDSAGQIFLRDVGLQEGQVVKVSKHLHTEPRSKVVTHFGSKYSVRLDNLQFDGFGQPEYHRVDDSVFQHVLMNHTTVGYNLVVSVEWDAEPSYLLSTMLGFMNMANLYYDIADGQLVFDTIAVVDDRANWDAADIWVFANNVVWPHVRGLAGIHSYYTFFPTPVQMPRQDFGGDMDANRNQSYLTHPINVNEPNDFRAKAHELGHYMLGFADEYRFGFLNLGSRCSPARYGYMDSHYESSDRSTEMSSAAQYAQSACQNSDQWRTHGSSCWDTWEAELEATRMGIKAPILKPEERELPLGRVEMSGPNAFTGALDYDVGQRIIFPVTPTAPAATSRLFRTVLSTTGAPLSGAAVTSFGPSSGMVQGATSDDGHIWVLGYKPGEGIVFTHWTGAFASGQFVGGASLAANADSTVVELKPAAGNPKMIQSLSFASGTATIHQAFDISLPGPPSALRYSPGADGPHAFTGVGDSVAVSFHDSLGFSGLILETALDVASDTFYFSSQLDYTGVSTLNDWVVVVDPSGEATVSRDSLATDVHQAGILCTHFPVPRNGLDSAALQAGPAVSFTTDPDIAAPDGCGIRIRYEDSEFSGSAPFRYESSLRIFGWNKPAQTWVLVGGSVDTLQNEVSAPLAGSGVYAAFTTEQVTGVGEGALGGVIPRGYELSQNVPNPFNPNTSFSYHVPQPGHVTLRIHNMLGQTVRVLVNEVRAAGEHRAVWDGRTTSGNPAGSGVYFYSLRAGDVVLTRKMVLMK